METGVIHILRATDGSIEFNAATPYVEEGRIPVGSNDIITVAAEQNIQVIEVVDLGPQGRPGDKGEPGLSGAGKPFYEVVSGELFESTSSISIIPNLSVTGSVFVRQYLAVGEDIVSSPPARFQIIGNDTGSVDIIRIGNQSRDFLRINPEGVTIFGQTSGSVPTPVLGGMYFSGNAFYVGI